MTIQIHTFRRGAIYTWRKRLPAKLGGGVLQLSLRTSDPLIGRRIAAILGGESCGVIDAMVHQGLSKEDARRLLGAVIVREHQKIQNLRLAAAEAGHERSWQQAKSYDWAVGKALTLLAERGASACPLTDQDRDSMRDEGRTEAEIAAVQTVLEQEARTYAEDPRQGLNTRSLRLMREVLERQEFSPLELLHGRQIYYRGRGAALLDMSAEQAVTEQASDLAAELARAQVCSDPPVAIEAAARAEATPSAPSVATAPVARASLNTGAAHAVPCEQPAYDPQLTALVARLMDQKRRQGMSGGMILQMTRVFALFVEATGVEDVRALRQEHIAKFVDTLQLLPVHYGKSPKDRGKPLRVILENARGQPVGLSATTINRNLDYIGQLLIKGRSEGFRGLGDLDPNSLRQRKTKRDRDDRPPFTAEDVQAIFRHPVWHGFQSTGRWQQPGNMLTKDGFYWLPLIAALSGARRGEIAGLKAAEIGTVDGIPCMTLQINRNRGLKNLTSARVLPLHPQLLELGLVDHAESRLAKGGQDADLFPDMRPKTLPSVEDAADDDEGGKFGDKINYRFNKLVDRQVTANRAKKTFHSFRHYVATQLGRLTDVPDQVRKDILGHAGSSITEERYTETSPLAAKLAALERLPRLPL